MGERPTRRRELTSKGLKDQPPAGEGDPQPAHADGWLRRFLSSWLERSPGGDVIAAQVGAGARGVIVGKNNIQIGTLVLPTLPVVVTLVLLVLGTATFLWWKLVPAEMPISPLNIAIADIGMLDGAGDLRPSEDGQNLGGWIYRELQSAYQDLPQGQPVVWHDSMTFLEKRATIGAIEGATAEQRTVAARELADRINANMVIYGVLTETEDRVTFSPEFYVADVLAQADELVGPHQLGDPLALRLPLDPQDLRTSEYLRAELGTRIDALTWLTRAMVLDANGRHQDALAVLEQAESQLPDWEANQGKEILYYFMGRQALYLSREDDSWLPEAERHYLQAIEINLDYARAHFGLGGVYHGMVQGLPPTQARLESEVLELSILHYQKAIAGSAAAPGSFVELKSRLGLGAALRLLGEAHLLAADYAAAGSALDEATGHIEGALPEIPPQDQRLQAEAYLVLGATYQQRAHVAQVQGDTAGSIALYRHAEAAYGECIQHADQDLYDASSQDLKEERCEPYRLEVLNVLAGLGEQG